MRRRSVSLADSSHGMIRSEIRRSFRQTEATDDRVAHSMNSICSTRAPGHAAVSDAGKLINATRHRVRGEVKHRKDKKEGAATDESHMTVQNRYGEKKMSKRKQVNAPQRPTRRTRVRRSRKWIGIKFIEANYRVKNYTVFSGVCDLHRWFEFQARISTFRSTEAAFDF